MVKKRKTLEDEINEFLQVWGLEQLQQFINDIIPLFDLYNVEEDDDWVKDQVGAENTTNVRLIRTVYLISKIAEHHSSALCKIKIDHRKIWERLESIEAENGSESN